MDLPIFSNLHSISGTLGQPWLFNPGAEALAAMKRMPKRKRREYLGKPVCGWCLLSPVMGEIPTRRISNDLNQVKFACAFVFDYDAPVSPEMRDQYLKTLPADLRPTYTDTTLGDNMCAIWVFESTLPLSGNAHYTETLKEFSKLIGAETLFPGFDRASYNATQVYTSGAQYNLVGPYLKTEIVEGLAVKAFSRLVQKETTTLNLDLVYEELERKYPGAWVGDFKVGATGTRFWDPSADNRRGAMVMEGGMYCLTGDRAFIRWDDPVLLGREWVSKHQLLQYGYAAADIYFDDHMYWRKLPNGEWAESQENNIRLELKMRGCSGTKAKGDNTSQVDDVIHYIQSQKRITAALPLIYQRPGILTIDGETVLNISTIKVLQPINISDLCQS
jgi:hypothetical protein